MILQLKDPTLTLSPETPRLLNHRLRWTSELPKFPCVE